MNTSKRFNPRTRVGCDPPLDGTVGLLGVSIHAPVWGATGKQVVEDVKGMFQSTHPCGVRLTYEVKKGYGYVSIHAPVWGATIKSHFITNFISVSIHAPVWGATFSRSSEITRGAFQSTHPCGVRPCQCQRRVCDECFNPRTRVGCDL